MSVFDAASFDDHEQLVFAADRESGLQAIIAIHSTRLGPAVGGCRMYPYSSEGEALQDVLRLSRGMSYKTALAGLPMGGGKSVIIANPKTDKSPELLRAMAKFIDRLGGGYVAAEDSGTSVEDLRLMGRYTPHVSGIAATEHGGDPSPSTAYGVYVAIATALRHRLGTDSFAGVTVAVQGLGHVGFALARLLREAGADVIGADISSANLDRAERELGVLPVSQNDILSVDADVFAPCALGGALNAQTIGKLRVGIVAGAANNQLECTADAAHLMDRGILYCPDFLINAGGIIDVHYQRSGLDRAKLKAHIDLIGGRLNEVIIRADAGHRSTALIAEELAEELITSAPVEVLPQLCVA